MTDSEVIQQVMSCIDPSVGRLQLLRRNGRLLLGLPQPREAAVRTLRLYQPQRLAGRMMAAGVRLLATAGLHTRILGSWKPACDPISLTPPLPEVTAGSCGVMLGSPEHRIRRAIASYRTASGWEVAKIAFGADGSKLLEREAHTLLNLSAEARAVPTCFGIHHGNGITLLRMPYLRGEPIKPGDFVTAIALLHSWISDLPLMPTFQYGEWQPICKALEGTAGGEQALGQLSLMKLKPVICHGDFARWNLLKQANGELIVLDWEWGHAMGMPGIDLVHYFLQDARLVRRLPAAEAIAATIQNLKDPACLSYLRETGWECEPILPIIACLAYKQGAGHQENSELLRVAVAACV